MANEKPCPNCGHESDGNTCSNCGHRFHHKGSGSCVWELLLLIFVGMPFLLVGGCVASCLVMDIHTAAISVASTVVGLGVFLL